MSVDLDRGAGYGNTLTWAERDKSKIGSAARRNPAGSGQRKVLPDVCDPDERARHRRIERDIFRG